MTLNSRLEQNVKYENLPVMMAAPPHELMDFEKSDRNPYERVCVACGKPEPQHSPTCFGMTFIQCREWRLRGRINAIFSIEDEGEWVVYCAGKRVFSSTEEYKADDFAREMKATIQQLLGLRWING